MGRGAEVDCLCEQMAADASSAAAEAGAQDRTHKLQCAAQASTMPRCAPTSLHAAAHAGLLMTAAQVNLLQFSCHTCCCISEGQDACDDK